ncbi:MAG: GPP34 family phosphoprotein [Bacteroidales bacterium]|nr:GPP34 family phosphoprotein [Bacteroidales bacterium]MCF8338955.1 GPP34 family phosphoprotein [Bacteroidales bacterium]
MLPESLTVKEVIYLQAVKNNTGKAPLKHENLHYGIIGGAILELTSRERITIENKKLIVQDSTFTNDRALDYILNKLQNRKKPRKIKTWVSAFTDHYKKLQKPIRESLIDKGYMKAEHKRFLGIFPYTIHPIIKEKEKQEVNRYLHDIILQKESYTEKEGAVISMLYLSGVFQTIFSEKKERKQARKKIKHQIKEGLISSAVSESIKEMQAAMIAAVTAASAAAAAAGSSSN